MKGWSHLARWCCGVWFLALLFCQGAAAQAPVRIALIETLSGPLANGGEAAFRNLVWATERVNARGGVALPGGGRPLQMVRYDSKGQSEEALAALRAAIDDGIRIVMQGNSSAVAAALIDAIGKHNEREPDKRVVFLNYAAVDPVLTNERCSYWHFRFDAHACLDAGPARGPVGAAHLSDWAGLQLWSGGAARRPAPAWPAAPGCADRRR
jgi:branched-chain amino acid transport system substrate-binding protein